MLRRVADRLSMVLAAIACAVLVALMLITFVDVVGRYLFSAPLTFAVEIISIGVGVLVLFGLAITTLNRGHIAVDLIAALVPASINRILAAIASFSAVIFISLIAWRLWDRGMNFMGDGLRTDVLEMPVFPFVLMMAVAAGVAALIALYQLVTLDDARAEPELNPDRDA